MQLWAGTTAYGGFSSLSGLSSTYGGNLSATNQTVNPNIFQAYVSAYGSGLNTVTLSTPGSGYNNGTYTNVVLTTLTGTGSGAKATVIVSANQVVSVTITTQGSGYAVNDTFGLTTGFDAGGTSTNFVGTATTIGYTGSKTYSANFTGSPILLSSISPTNVDNGALWNNSPYLYYYNGSSVYQLNWYNNTGTSTLAPVITATANNQSFNPIVFQPTLNTGTGVGTVSITTPGTAYNNGTYTGVKLITSTGSGSGALATVVVTGGAITSVTPTTYGTGYAVNNTFGLQPGFDGGAELDFVGKVTALQAYTGLSISSAYFANYPITLASVTTPTTLQNGNIWQNSNHIYARLNGVTYQLDAPTVLGTVATGIWNATAIGAQYGGTGQTTYTIGDILYASAATTISKLSDVATGNALISGGVGVAPSYGKIGLTTHISGVLPIANGGTNLSATPANGQLLIGNATGYTLATLTQGTGMTISNASGSISIANAGVLSFSGGTTGLTPATATTGTITLAGILAVANGGTGVATITGILKGNGTSAFTAAVANTDYLAPDAVNTATDAAYTITTGAQMVKLPVITANRVLTLPSAATYKGTCLSIWNQNTSSTYSWSFSGAVKDAGNNTITNLNNSAWYILESDGTNWLKQN